MEWARIAFDRRALYTGYGEIVSVTNQTLPLVVSSSKVKTQYTFPENLDALNSEVYDFTITFSNRWSRREQKHVIHLFSSIKLLNLLKFQVC